MICVDEYWHSSKNTKAAYNFLFCMECVAGLQKSSAAAGPLVLLNTHAVLSCGLVMSAVPASLPVHFF